MGTLKDFEGVYFERDSYAGFWQRLAVDVLDSLVILPILVLVTILITNAFTPSEAVINCLFVLWATCLFLYFVLLKRTTFGTIGYKICKVRVVDLRGETPSIPALTLRLMFAAFGPLNFPLDLLWISGDDNSQALRDKFAKTYVIKKDATPKGTGSLTRNNYDLWGWHLIFCEVKRPDLPEKR